MKHGGWYVVSALAVASCTGDAVDSTPKASSLNDEPEASCGLRADAGMWDKRNWGKCLEGLLADSDGSGIGMEAITARLPGEDGVNGTNDDMFETTVAKRAKALEPESE